MRTEPSVRARELAMVLWNYLRVGDEISDADAILVLGSQDVRVAEQGARLQLAGRAPLLVLSGCRGPFTRDWPRTEAEVFADAAARLGVRREDMLLETWSTNTGENIRFTRKLVEERGLDLARWIVVTAPYCGRRARATFRHFWPGKEVRMSSPPIPFERYATDEAPLEFILHRLAGETHRMLEYPARGWQAPEEVPDAVMDAWRGLVELGYDRSLVQ